MPMKNVIPWPSNANIAFGLLPAEDVLPWPGNANIASGLLLVDDVLSWPGNANTTLGLLLGLQCLLRTWCEYGHRLGTGIAIPLTYLVRIWHPS